MAVAYPASVREVAEELIRTGTTPEDLMAQYGLARGTVYRWLEHLRSKGEDVSFVKRAAQYRETAIARFSQGVSVQSVSDELPVSRSQLYRWRDEFERENPSCPPVTGCPPDGDALAAGIDAPAGRVRRRSAEAEKDILIRHLKEALAEKTMEVSFFRGALRRIEARRQRSSGCGETPSSSRSDR